jgi:anti-sigma B factor antagonist
MKPEPAANEEFESIVVSIVGELDMARESELLNLVMTLDPPAATTVVIDLREVTFVDSKGLDSIIKAKVYLEGRGCEMVLRQPQTQLVRLLEMLSLDQYLNVADQSDGDRPGSSHNGDAPGASG